MQYLIFLYLILFSNAVHSLYDATNLPSTEVTLNEDRGTKTVVQYYCSEDGDVVKETKEYRTEKRLVSSHVAKRKKWAKFGAAKGDLPGGNSANTYPAEVVTLQLVQARQPENEQERPEDDASKSKTRVQASLCRYCKGSHFSHKCPNKSDMEAMQALRDKLKGKTEGEDSDKPLEPIVSTGRYLPPPLRNAAASASVLGSSASSEKRSFDGHTVRVTNLPSDTTSDDLKQIFSPFGHVVRIYPAKDKITQQNRGFAFISYSTREEATAAIYGVNGLRHNHVVLKVDWAKP